MFKYRFLLLIVITFAYCTIGCTPKVSETVSATPIEKPTPTPIKTNDSSTETEITEVLPKKQDDIPIPIAINYLITSIKKTPCYGRCPVFEVKFFSDGNVIYHGRRFAKRTGHYEAKLHKQQLEELLKVIKELRLTDFADQYPVEGSRIADIPTTVTAYGNQSGIVKSIRNYYDAPKSLKTYETYLLELTERLEWTKMIEGN